MEHIHKSAVEQLTRSVCERIRNKGITKSPLHDLSNKEKNEEV
jgi:hypothetical protein